MTKSFGNVKILAKFVFFYYNYNLKYSNTFDYCFERINLSKFISCENGHSRRNYAWRLFYKPLYRFSFDLKENLIATRRKISLDMFLSLIEGLLESFK